MNANVSSYVGPGGVGGGGNAAADYNIGPVAAQAGATNTGSGGGGACWENVPTGYPGGSGLVLIRYQSPVQIATGGTVYSSGGYIYHKFTSSGNFVL
jgi:hypothetical protein